jgi:GST-like protein
MPIELHAFDTPNGRKISIALEEMALPYTVRIVDIGKGQQFDAEFLKISPNGKIPAIIDTEGPGGRPVSVFESGAILIYLGEKTGRFWPRDLAARIPVLEWLMFQHGGFGPIAGQVHHFATVENEADRRYGLERFSNETGGCMQMDRRLATHRFFSRTSRRSPTSPSLGGCGGTRDTMISPNSERGGGMKRCWLAPASSVASR